MSEPRQMDTNPGVEGSASGSDEKGTEAAVEPAAPVHPEEKGEAPEAEPGIDSPLEAVLFSSDVPARAVHRNARRGATGPTTAMASLP